MKKYTINLNLESNLDSKPIVLNKTNSIQKDLLDLENLADSKEINKFVFKVPITKVSLNLESKFLKSSSQDSTHFKQKLESNHSKHTANKPPIHLINQSHKNNEFANNDFINSFSNNDFVILEDRLSVYLNGTKIISTMCLLDSQDAYAVGFLMSEGVIEKISDIESIKISQDGLKVYVNAKILESNLSNLYHEKTLTSGCCVGVSANFEGKIISKFITSKISFNLKQIGEFLDIFRKDSELFNLTGCSHKVMLFCENKCLLAEDIGRHNALDKAIGKARLQGVDMSKAILIVSGRLSMEMVIKCAMNDIPIVISKSATTLLAIKSALKLGITLIGFARGETINIYTHKNRIVLE